MKEYHNRIFVFAITIRKVRTFYTYEKPTTDIHIHMELKTSNTMSSFCYTTFFIETEVALCVYELSCLSEV